ncbi:MAG TPA: hypothetical protein VH062_34070 [Polyangiaceae bacterium]|jgi:hypothetical protein|nr:hypothetical protein [Polyangiaceae bacterium]
MKTRKRIWWLLLTLATVACGGAVAPEKPLAAAVGDSSYCDAEQANDVGAIFAKPFSTSTPTASSPPPVHGSVAATSAFVSALDPKTAGNAFSAAPEFRHRAALVCACRAKRNRHGSRRNGFFSDLATVLGILGTVGGGAVSALGSRITDEKGRARYANAGSALVAFGAICLSITASLALPKRSVELDSAAEDQEYATAVLWNDNVSEPEWARNWAACVHGESLQSTARPDNANASPPANAPPQAPQGPSASNDTTNASGVHLQPSNIEDEIQK